MGPPWGSHVLYRLIYGQHEKIFSSETTRHRALKVGMQHHLMDLYQVYLNYTPEAKNGSAAGIAYLTYAYIRENIKSSCLKPQGRLP